MRKLAAIFLLVIGLSGFLIPGRVPAGLELFTYKNKAGQVLPVKKTKDWEKKRAQILDSMQAVMGRLPEHNEHEPVPVRFLDSLREQNYKRYTIILHVADWEEVTAYLYTPIQRKALMIRHPAMLALHETDMIGKKSVDGQGKNKNLGYAKELAERGYVVIAPDYPSFGDSKDYDFKKDRYQSGTMKGIFNHIRCVDYLVSRKDVYPGRIGVIGHSLGGHNAMFVAAFDKRLKVVVSSCGWTMLDYYNIGNDASKKYGGRLGPYAQERYMPLFKEKYNLDESRIPFDYDELIGAIAPRPFFSNSPLRDSNFDVKGVKAGIEKVLPVYRLFDKEKNLSVAYPDALHDFPAEVREEAYQFIDQALSRSAISKSKH